MRVKSDVMGHGKCPPATAGFGWEEGAMSPGRWSASGSWRMQGGGFFQKAPEGHGLGHPGMSPVRPASDISPLTETLYICRKPPRCGHLCSSRRD